MHRNYTPYKVKGYCANMAKLSDGCTMSHTLEGYFYAPQHSPALSALVCRAAVLFRHLHLTLTLESHGFILISNQNLPSE